MEEIGRRSVLAVGLAAAAAPALVSSRAAMAQAYGPDEGKEIAPGVREIEVSQREAIIPGYKTVKMLDIVFQPGSHAPQETLGEHDAMIMTRRDRTGLPCRLRLALIALD